MKPYFSVVYLFSWKVLRFYKISKILVKKGLYWTCKSLNKVDMTDAESRSSPSNFSNTNLHLFCSEDLEPAQAFLEFEFLEFEAHSCVLKISHISERFTPRDCETLARSGHHCHLCQSKLQHSTCDSLNRFPFHQSRPVKSHHETGKCAVTLHTCEWEVTPKTFWEGVGAEKKRLRKNQQEQVRKGKLEVKKHTLLLIRDQHHDRNPHSGSWCDTLQKSAVVRHDSEQRALLLA